MKDTQCLSLTPDQWNQNLWRAPSRHWLPEKFSRWFQYSGRLRTAGSVLIMWHMGFRNTYEWICVGPILFSLRLNATYRLISLFMILNPITRASTRAMWTRHLGPKYKETLTLEVPRAFCASPFCTCKSLDLHKTLYFVALEMKPFTYLLYLYRCLPVWYHTWQSCLGFF